MIPLMMGCCSQKNSVVDDNQTEFSVQVVGSATLYVTVMEGSGTIDWGDGNTEPLTSYELKSHAYSSGSYNGLLRASVNSEVIIAGVPLSAVGKIQEGLRRIGFYYPPTERTSPNLISVPAEIPRSIRSFYAMFVGGSGPGSDISGWDVSLVDDMDEAFYLHPTFNQDLSGWCVSLIPTEPPAFSSGASAWLLPKPIWGTCPGA